MVRGGIIGITWGTVVGGFDGFVVSGRELGTAMAKHTSRAVFTSTISFASFLGCYSGVTCLAEHVRNRDDWKNAAIAGGVTGACAPA